MGCIYEIRNKISGTTYVGKTTKKPIKRFRQHLTKLKQGCHYNKHLQASYNFHGEGAFGFRVLFVVSDDELDDVERAAIASWRRHSNCCNVTDGGDGGGPQLGATMSAAINSSATLYAQRVGHLRKIGTDRQIAVEAVDSTGAVHRFDSCKEASIALGAQRSKISLCLSGVRPRHLGFTWRRA